MPAGNTCSGHSSRPVLWCMQGVRPCHFIDPGFCQPACVTPKTRICHPLCHFMVYAGGQHLSFYRPWLLQTAFATRKTRMCHPLCYVIGHAGSQTLAFARAGMHWSNPCGLSCCTVHLCSYETSRGFTWAHAKRSQRHLRSKASPTKNLEQHNSSREHLQWPQQWPCFMVYAGVRPCHFIDPGFCQPTCVTPQNPHLSPLVPFYGVCRGSAPVIL